MEVGVTAVYGVKEEGRRVQQETVCGRGRWGCVQPPRQIVRQQPPQPRKTPNLQPIDSLDQRDKNVARVRGE